VYHTGIRTNVILAYICHVNNKFYIILIFFWNKSKWN